MSTAPLTLCTAGHIDHGKTALIAALTGVDTDRLPQERARGISIELGYARMVLPSGRHLSVIDVPGHERFVRTMVAGATGVDLYLMTVAADDGPMPQTREHAKVLAALGVRSGVVAVTKRDLLDPEPAMLEAADLLPEAEVVPVSVRTGDGLHELLQAVERVATTTDSRAAEPGPARLHADRAFTIRGAGTVVTGTLWAGTIARGDQLEILPGGRTARVRTVQVHDDQVEQAHAGQRVAVNLVGVTPDQVARGAVLSAPDSALRESYVLDATLDFDAKPGARVQVHHGTRESPARLRQRDGHWRIELEQPLAAQPGDRFVIRQIAPPDTLGGGVVSDTSPTRTASGVGGGGRGAREARPTTVPSEPLRESALKLERRLREAGFEPPLATELDAEDLTALRQAGKAVRVSRALHYHPDVLSDVRERIVALAGDTGSVTLAQLRDDLGTSRKFAQALLEHFDAQRLTIRRGDAHQLRRAAESP